MELFDVMLVNETELRIRDPEEDRRLLGVAFVKLVLEIVTLDETAIEIASELDQIRSEIPSNPLLNTELVIVALARVKDTIPVVLTTFSLSMTIGSDGVSKLKMLQPAVPIFESIVTFLKINKLS